MNFSRDHFSTLIKYIGISFITGAISHGAFSGTRSLLTGSFGVICFTVGTLLENDAKNTWKTLLAGAVLAIGIGCVTGGLQHFPDSPERSVLIIPIGYILSVFLFASLHNYILTKKEYLYIAISSIFMLILSLGLFFVIEKTGITGHSHEDTHHDTHQESGEDASLREHCKMMPEMAGCEKYATPSNNLSLGEKKSLNDLILTDDETTKDVKPTEIINLKDGDTYPITIQKVRKVINGEKFILLSYNGSVPGPTFRVPKGATIKFQIQNTVPELGTTIHPHGIRLNSLYDGVPKDQGRSQNLIRKGDIYEQIITFPDTGIMWYHPHARDDFEQELGEYGTFLVYDPNEKQRVDSESVITLDDILIENGVIPPFKQESINYALMGRYGNTMFINGDTDFSLSMKQNEVKRLYLVNTANARPFQFRIPGVKMKLVGGDIGYYDKEVFRESIIISPAERYIVDIMSDTVGDFPIQSIGGGKALSLGTLKVLPSTTVSVYKKEFETLKTHNILQELKNDISYYQSKTVDKTLKMTGEGNNMDRMMHMHGNSEGIEWEDTMPTMNKNSSSKTLKWIFRDEQTGKKGMDIDWSFKKGELVKIRIIQDKNSMHPMQHPFHMHGQRFLILNQNGTPNTHFVWKDTVLIPKDEYVDILVDMSNPGKWMAHCHITEHLLSGMMFGYRVF